MSVVVNRSVVLQDEEDFTVEVSFDPNDESLPFGISLNGGSKYWFPRSDFDTFINTVREVFGLD